MHRAMGCDNERLRAVVFTQWAVDDEDTTLATGMQPISIQ